MFNKIMQKIPPYQAEFIFRGLRKGWPNLHRNVRLSFKSSENNPLRSEIYFPLPQERAAKFAPDRTPQF